MIYNLPNDNNPRYLGHLRQGYSAASSVIHAERRSDDSGHATRADSVAVALRS